MVAEELLRAGSGARSVGVLAWQGWGRQQRVLIVVGEGWEKHLGDFVLCGLGSTPGCRNAAVGFLLLF